MKKVILSSLIAIALPLAVNAGLSFGLVKAAKKTGDKVDAKVAQKKEEIRIAAINNAPLLDWTGETNYTADGVNPETGTSTMTFVFRVKYTDVDNEAPDSGYPKLHIKIKGVEISGSPFGMTLVSGGYSSGAIYSLSTLLEPNTNYAYNFEVNDQRGLSATGQPTIDIGKPRVAGWIFQTIETLSSYSTGSSLKLDANGDPKIAYYNYSPPLLKYAVWNGIAWSTQTIEALTGSYSSPSLALDATGNANICYSGSNLKYAKWNGTIWSTQTVNGTWGAVTEANALALTSDYSPRIAYRDNGVLKYSSWNTSWSTQTVDASVYVDRTVSLALDPSNNPHISYRDNTNGDLRYAKWTGAAWSIETVDSTGNVGGDTAIGLDSNSYPHIAYYDVTNKSLKYAKWNGSAWQTQTLESSNGVAYPSMRIDTNGRPHIAYSYYSTANQWYTQYAYWDGNSWQIRNILSGTYIFMPSLALDADNIPYIAGIDGNSVLRYIVWIQ